MEKVLNLRKKSVLMKAAMIAASTVASVVFVQLFHYIGIISGLDSAVGAALLPMHIPVLVSGFMFGPAVGLVTGALSPIFSSLISGMPVAPLVPFMVAELAVYGLVAGGLSRTKLPVFPSLIIAQVAGRAVRAAAVLFAVYALDNTSLTPASAGAFIVSGLFGIIIQWIAVPFAVEKLQGLRKRYE